jgi:EpsI family protein
MASRTRRQWLLLGVVLLATFGMRVRLSHAAVVPLRQPLADFPAQVGPWRLLNQPALGEDVLSVLKADDYMMRNYVTAQGKEAQLFVAYYRSQHAGEAMHSPKNCLPGSGWEPIVNDTIPLKAGPPGTRVNRYVVENSGERTLILYWYEAQGHIIASEYAVKFYLVWDAMRQGRRDGAIVRVLVPMSQHQSIASATSTALDLANRSLPLLNGYLPK